MSNKTLFSPYFSRYGGRRVYVFITSDAFRICLRTVKSAWQCEAYSEEKERDFEDIITLSSLSLQSMGSFSSHFFRISDWVRSFLSKHHYKLFCRGELVFYIISPLHEDISVFRFSVSHSFNIVVTENIKLIKWSF